MYCAALVLIDHRLFLRCSSEGRLEGTVSNKIAHAKKVELEYLADL